MEEARGHARLETSRRHFLAGAAATGAGVLLPAELSAAGGRRRRRRKVDVAVVGAGLAGLTAAQRLSRARVGGLPARGPRSRGRAHAQPSRRARRDRRARRPIRRTDPGPSARPGRFARRRHVPHLQRGRQRPPAQRPALALPGHPGLSPDPEFQEAILTAIAKFDPMAAEVPVDAPWKAPRAAEWDAITLEAWKQQNLTTPGSKKLFDIACEAIWGAEPRRDVAALCVGLHRRRRKRDHAGQLPPAGHDAGRRPGVALRRRIAADSAAVGPPPRRAGRAEVAGAQHRAGPGTRDRDERPPRGGGRSGDRRAAARGGPARSTSLPPCRGPSASC